MIDFTLIMPIKLLYFKKGHLTFLCTCGRLGKVPINSFTPLARCPACSLAASVQTFKVSKKTKINLAKKLIPYLVTYYKTPVE